MSKITKTKLKKLNLIAAGLHLIQAVVVLLISKDFILPITGNFLKFDESTKTLVPATKTVFELKYVWLIVGFFLLSALAHFFIATIYNKKYNRDLASGINRIRWLEYALSASTMMVAIALLVGVYDVSSLIMIFSLTAFMNLMGLAMETYNQKTEMTNWLTFIIGSIAGIIPWLVIALYMWLGASDGSQAPTFVYFIFVSIFIFFNCFALNMFLQYKRIGKWADYLYGEKTYIWLSLIAKSLLAWQVFGGTLRP